MYMYIAGSVHLVKSSLCRNLELESLSGLIEKLKERQSSSRAAADEETHTTNEQDMYVSGAAHPHTLTPSPPPPPPRAVQSKLLRLERDNRELERSLQATRSSSDRTSAEMEKMNKKQTAQIHADKREIARLKEVRTSTACTCTCTCTSVDVRLKYVHSLLDFIDLLCLTKSFGIVLFFLVM